MRTTLLIAGAGALGAVARYGFESYVTRRVGTSFPWGTFVVNITGALALGFLFTIFTGRFRIQPAYRSAVTIGFLGAYTTFSTLAFESVRLMEDGAWLLGGANVLGSVAAGLVAMYVGMWLGRLL